jgi:excisionase family DNA binding protein
MSDLFETAQEIAELLNVPVTWVRRETRAGRMPFVPLGRYRRYDRDDVLAWVESLKSGGGPSWRKHRPT